MSIKILSKYELFLLKILSAISSIKRSKELDGGARLCYNLFVKKLYEGTDEIL